MKRIAAALAVSFLFATPGRAASSTDFGFAGKEMFPVDNFIGALHVADIDGEGKNDLVLVNNSRARINILYNQTGNTNPPAAKPDTKRDVNELPPDARFRIESIASEKRIAALVVADLNSDGRPDLAYYGEPKELVVQCNLGTNGWAAPKRWPIEDGVLSANALNEGDLNGDGRTDLLLLSEKHVYFLAQKTDGTFAEPEKIPLSSPARAAQAVDVNGDGRKDLLLVNWESATPFRFRLQNAAGQLGPENYFNFPAIRSFTADNLTTNGGTQIITIALNSGRAQISQFAKKPAPALTEDFREGQFQVLPLTGTDKARRGLALGDVNGDGLADLLVAQPESGQLSLYQQQPDGTLAPPRSFPTLAGVSEIAVSDWDNDKRAEIFLLSPDEKQLGVTRLDDKGRLPFPTLIALDGKPLAMAVAPMKAGVKATLAVIVDNDGRRTLITRNADGTTRTQKLADSFKSNPASLTWHDVDQDGLADLVVLVPYEKIKVLRQVARKDFEEMDVAPPGGVLDQPWLASADVDGDGKAELLLPQKNFVRAVVLNVASGILPDVEPGVPPGGTTVDNRSASGSSTASNRPAPNPGGKIPPSTSTKMVDATGWVFTVRDQINGAASNSRITGAALVPGAHGPALFLLDAERKALTLAQRDAAGVWQAVKNVSLPVSAFGSLQPLALGGKQPNAVGFLGVNAVAWLPLAGETWELAQLDNYETSIKDGFLRDVIPGDLNGDGRKDLVFLETARHYVDLVVFDAANRLVPANRWQVFEERSFRGARSEMSEPREAVVSDVTGDGKNDLILLVHDRVIVYPQE